MADDGPASRRVAAVDCGTNSTRLLIASGDGTALDRRMRITRLGEGVDRSGELDPGAIARTLDVLVEYGEAMASAGVTSVLGVATSAIRDASNAESFLGPAGEALRTELAVLSGDEEGRLSYRGATRELPVSGGPYVVVDLGGGSTEIVTEGGDGSIEAVSLDVGCVRVTERFLGSDPPTVPELADAREYVADLVEAAVAAHPELSAGGSARGGGWLVGLAGTVSALAMASLGLEAYDRAAVHHLRLGQSYVADLLHSLAAEDVVKRRARPGMEHDRADVIVGGALALLIIMEGLGFDELIVSESDILDGIVHELLGR